MTQIYNDPAGGSPSSVGSQIRTDHFLKKALVEARKEQYFMPLADVTAMPKNMGKKIKRYHYLPLLEDANINDQGLDAAGASTTRSVTIIVKRPDAYSTGNSEGNAWLYFQAEGASGAAARTAAEAKVMEYVNVVLGLDTSNALYDTYAEVKAYYEGLTPAWTFDDTGADVAARGNLYGSSKDIGTITSKLPALTENGGQVNRVGFKRIELEGTIEKYGFFDEYTKESVDFDTDAELMMHINREMVNGATEITEDLLQIDIINGAGVVRYGGDATTTAELTGEGTLSTADYDDFVRLAIDLDDNRCPKNTKVITGTRMIDTKTINAARFMYVGTEVVPTLKKMTDPFGNQAFHSVEKYAAGTTVMNGEIGAIDQFRIIQVPEMVHWEGAGAAVGTNTGYRESGGNYNVYPMLVVGSESFTTIGFQTDGKTVKFKVKHAKPESTESYAGDPYGEKGFMSIKWYYGTMILRPERIALLKVVAEW